MQIRAAAFPEKEIAAQVRTIVITPVQEARMNI